MSVFGGYIFIIGGIIGSLFVIGSALKYGGITEIPSTPGMTNAEIYLAASVPFAFPIIGYFMIRLGKWVFGQLEPTTTAQVPGADAT